MAGFILSNIAIYAGIGVALFWVVRGFKRSWWSAAWRGGLFVAMAAAYSAPGLIDRARFAERERAEGGSHYYGVGTLTKGIALWDIFSDRTGPNCMLLCQELLLDEHVDFVEVVDAQGAGNGRRRFFVVRGAAECAPVRQYLDNMQNKDLSTARLRFFDLDVYGAAIAANICLGYEDIQETSALANVKKLSEGISGFPYYFGRHEVTRYEVWAQQSDDVPAELISASEGSAVWVPRIPPYYSCTINWTGGQNRVEFHERLSYREERVDLLIQKSFAIGLDRHFIIPADSLPAMFENLSAEPGVRVIAAKAIADLISDEHWRPQGLRGTLQLAPELLALLIRAVHDPDKWVRMRVINALGALGAQARPALPDLRQIARSDADFVRLHAENAINRIEAAQ